VWAVQCAIDERQHAVQIPIDVGAFDTQDSEASITEPTIALRVRIEPVLTVIHLDDEPLLEANKINNAAIARRLTAEVNAPPSPGAQMIPQFSFLRAHRFAHAASGFFSHSHTPPASKGRVPVSGQPPSD